MNGPQTIGLDELVDGYIKTRDVTSEEHDYWSELVDAAAGELTGIDGSLDLDLSPMSEERMLDDAIQGALTALPDRPSPWAGFARRPSG